VRTIAVRRASSADLNELLALYDELAGPKLSAAPADHDVGGCHKVGLLSGKHRLEAHHFYRSMGFEAVAEGFKLYLDE
jgi:hypothetical protein